MLLRDRRIFVAEDNMQNRVIFKVILGKYGADLVFDRWGSTALAQLRRMPTVDLIILDLMLGAGISGLDVFMTIRALPEFARVPIVAVSATEPVAGIAKTREKGFSGFIAKPIDDDLFPKQIAALIAGESVWYAGERSLH